MNMEIRRVSYRETERDELGNLQTLAQLTFCGDCRFYEGYNFFMGGIDDPPQGICDHESNWRPGRGELQVWADCNCQYHELRNKNKE